MFAGKQCAAHANAEPAAPLRERITISAAWTDGGGAACVTVLITLPANSFSTQGLSAAVSSVKRTAADEKSSNGGRLERTLLRIVISLDKAYRGGQSRLDILGERTWFGSVWLTRAHPRDVPMKATHQYALPSTKYVPVARLASVSTCDQ